MMQELYVGVDVAKDWLDIHHPHCGARRIDNAPAALKAFSAACAKEGAWIVFEASGGYDHLLRAALEAAPVRFSRVNPRQARDFARAMGVIGKTDRVEARMLSELGARLRPAPTEPLAASRRALQAQATRRRQLVGMRKQEATRLQQTADAEARADIRSLIAVLDRRIAKTDAHMAALIAADPELAAVDRRLKPCRASGRSWLRPSSQSCRSSGGWTAGACRRQTRQVSPHGHRPKASRRPQRHADDRHRLQLNDTRLNTVAGKPGAVHPHIRLPAGPGCRALISPRGQAMWSGVAQR
jgi:hypothetical protein